MNRSARLRHARDRALSVLAVPLVLAAVLAVAPLPAGAQTAPPPDAPPPDAPLDAPPGPPFDAVVDLTLPADPRVTFAPSYHDPRDGGARAHRAADLMGQKLWKVYAAVDGTICYQNGVNEPMPSWGYALTLCGADGREYKYIHLNNDSPGTDDGRGGPELAYAPGVRRGVEVRRGQWIGYVGDSGNAESTAPHLHFEIHDPAVTDPYGSSRMDPQPSLAAARSRGDVPADPGDGPTAPVRRVAGPDRVGTAIALSQSAFPVAATVVVAPAGSFAEAVVAGPLAAQLSGPVLTTGAALDPRVADEIRRLGASAATLVGGPAVLPDAVADALADLGLEVERVGADDPFATAVAVARRVWERQAAVAEAAGRRPPTRTALLALGSHIDPNRAWPDALLASFAGAVAGSPVLLTAPDAVAPETVRALADVAQVTVVGGTAAIAEELLPPVREVASRVRRVSGPTRYATGVAVADDLLRSGRVEPGSAWVATAHNWADAVAAGPAVAARGDVLQLVDGLDRFGDGESARWLYARAPELRAGVVIGGTAAVSESAAERLGLRLR